MEYSVYVPMKYQSYFINKHYLFKLIRTISMPIYGNFFFKKLDKEIREMYQESIEKNLVDQNKINNIK